MKKDTDVRGSREILLFELRDWQVWPLNTKCCTSAQIAFT